MRRPAQGWRRGGAKNNENLPLIVLSILCEIIVPNFLNYKETLLKFKFKFEFEFSFLAKAQYLCNIVNEKLRVKKAD